MRMVTGGIPRLFRRGQAAPAGGAAGAAGPHPHPPPRLAVPDESPDGGRSARSALVRIRCLFVAPADTGSMCMHCARCHLVAWLVSCCFGVRKR